MANSFIILSVSRWFNKSLLRNKYRKKWQRHRRNITFRNYYHALKTEIDHQMSLARNIAWSNTLKSINTQQNNTNNIFKFVKIVKNKQHTIQTLKLGKNIFLTATEKCNALKTHFENSRYLTYNTSSPMERKVTKNNRIFFARNQNHSRLLGKTKITHEHNQKS